MSSDFDPQDDRRPEGTFVALPGGRFSMGTDAVGYPEDGEGPAHEVRLNAFAIDAFAVTNARFEEFVAATGHVSNAERLGWSYVFAPRTPWWRKLEGADWRHPEGPGTGVDERQDHPVVQVSWNDAQAFCAWSGTRLPTEAEWEYAARGGLAGEHFPWGAELEPGGEHRMNVFQGRFPHDNTCADGYAGTAPVDAYEPNGHGLYNTTGNVWEWCSDWFDPAYYAWSPPSNPRGPAWGTQRVMRGGSYLCHASHCRRYRVDARSANEPDSSTGNLGFRVVA